MHARRLYSVLATASAILVSQSAIAATLFEDVIPIGSGGYTADANLQGQNPAATVGFSGGWAGSNTSAYQPATAGLDMPNVPNGGGSLVNRYTAFNQTRSDSRAIAPYTGSDTLWISSLVSFNQAVLGNTGGSNFIGFLSGALPTTSSGGSQNATWITSNGGDLDGFAWGILEGRLTVRHQSGSDTVVGKTLTPGFDVEAGDTYLFLAKLEVNAAGDDALSVWLLQDAPLDESALGAPTVSITDADLVASNTSISRLVAYSAAPFSSSSGDVPATVTWDAIRMGTEYSDLIVIPEPSALGALSIGLALASRRHR